jgi:imidazolonepropionase-like amidohydrolase
MVTTMAATLITGANVWDGISDQTVPRHVLVVDGRIERLADAIERPPNAHVVDLSGHTLTPAFMDCHTHVTLTPQVGPAMAADSSIASSTVHGCWWRHT